MYSNNLLWRVCVALWPPTLSTKGCCCLNYRTRPSMVQIVCSWLVYDLFKTSLQLAYDLFMICSWLVHYLFMTCIIICYLFITCSQLVYNLFMTCLYFLWLAHYLFMTCIIICSLLVHFLLTNCSWNVHDMSTTCSILVPD